MSYRPRTKLTFINLDSVKMKVTGLEKTWKAKGEGDWVFECLIPHLPLGGVTKYNENMLRKNNVNLKFSCYYFPSSQRKT